MINFIKNYNSTNLPYRPGVGMMIANSANKIFVGIRVDTKIEAWQMPQGGINVGETPSAAAIREMKEELGTDSGYIVAESKFWYSYDLPEALIPKLWQGKFRGQKQKWFLIRFTGTEKEININSYKPEFSKWKWVELDELSKIIIPFKEKLYQKVLHEFKDILLKENHNNKNFTC